MSNFYQREYEVFRDVLEPNHQGEDLIILLKELDVEDETIVDLGCGAGHLGITAALEFPKAKLVFIDSSPSALNNSVKNAQAHGVIKRCVFTMAYFQNTTRLKKADIVITNLNFVPDGEDVDTDKPDSAIFGGPTGMELYQDFWDKLVSVESEVKHVFTLCRPEQQDIMHEMAREAGYEHVRSTLYANHYRRL